MQLKKVYSQLNSAFQMASVENGSPENWNWSNGENSGEKSDYVVRTYFSPYLKILKNCSTGEGCWQNAGYKNLKGNTTWVNIDKRDYISKVKLADGTSFYLYVYGEDAKCDINYSITNKKPLDGICAEVGVDINGDKGPAILGRDVFLFWITKYGISPYGLKDSKKWSNLSTYCSIGSDSTANGAGCTAWVLQHENMDYIRKNFACTGDGETGPWNCVLK